MTTTTTTGFICIPADGVEIYSVGATEDAAWDACVDAVGGFHDANGDDLTPDEARAQFVFYPATPALLAQIDDLGVRWSIVDDVAMTDEEAGNA